MQPNKTLLFIVHAPSVNTISLADAAEQGARHNDFTGVQVIRKTPLATQPEDIIQAQAVMLGTTENLGYMAGLTKDLFDRCYYPCLDSTQGMPFGYYIRAGHDGTGAQRAITSVTNGLRWKLFQPPLICRGQFNAQFTLQCKELGMAMSAGLEAGVI